MSTNRNESRHIGEEGIYSDYSECPVMDNTGFPVFIDGRPFRVIHVLKSVSRQSVKTSRQRSPRIHETGLPYLRLVLWNIIHRPFSCHWRALSRLQIGGITGSDDDVIGANDQIEQMNTTKCYCTVRRASTRGKSKPRTVTLSASP